MGRRPQQTPRAETSSSGQRTRQNSLVGPPEHRKQKSTTAAGPHRRYQRQSLRLSLRQSRGPDREKSRNSDSKNNPLGAPSLPLQAIAQAQSSSRGHL